jgi:oligoribonuclease NrnB/cAMP/cGMP phosphodiesterase (DHH superfamily)
MLVIHHNDADGRCAAGIVGRSSYAEGQKVEYLEADYGAMKVPVKKAEMLAKCIEHRVAFIVDFSLPEDDMKGLVNAGVELYWLDHHASVKGYSDIFEGLRDFTNKGRAGCELAWEFCHPRGPGGHFEKPMPRIVRMIGDYDTWRLTDEDSKPLVVYLDSFQPGPASDWWDRALEFTNDELDEIVMHGRMMTKYRDGYTSGLRKMCGFETTFHGLRCYALNVGRMGSLAMGTCMQTHAACLAFYWDGLLWTVSMYSEWPEVDCSEICREHGGGGHKGAAGFTCTCLPFFKTETA